MRKASTFYTGYQCVPVTHVISSLLHRSSRIANRLSLTTSELVTTRRPHLDAHHDERRLRDSRTSDAPPCSTAACLAASTASPFLLFHAPKLHRRLSYSYLYSTSLSVVHIDFFHSLPSSTSPMDKTRTIRRPITPEHGVNASVDGGKTGHPCEGVMCLLVPSKVT